MASFSFDEFMKKYNEIVKNVTFCEEEIRVLKEQEKNETTTRHAFDVAEVAAQFLLYLQMTGEVERNDQDVANIYRAGLFHDIGKTVIPQELIEKPGRTLKVEQDIIGFHAEYGGKILELLPIDPDVKELMIDCAENHHKHFSDISFLSRILAVADVYSALTMSRSYKDPVVADQLEFISKKNSLLDPELRQKLLDMITVFPELNHAPKSIPAPDFEARENQIIQFMKNKYGDRIVNIRGAMDQDNKRIIIGEISTTGEPVILEGIRNNDGFSDGQSPSEERIINLIEFGERMTYFGVKVDDYGKVNTEHLDKKLFEIYGDLIDLYRNQLNDKIETYDQEAPSAPETDDEISK